MAENKKSFVAYCDWQETFEELSNEEAGKLVKHLFNYVNDKDPDASDKLTKMCFIPIKQSLKRDLKKYEGYIKKQSDNGKKGGRPKNPTLSEKTQPFIEKAKKADSVSVSVSDSVSDNVNVINKENKDISFNFLKSIIDLGVEEQVAKDWMVVRKKKGGSNTLTAFNKIKKEIEVCSATPNECIKLSAGEDWKGFKASWYENCKVGSKQGDVSDDEKAYAENVQECHSIGMKYTTFGGVRKTRNW